MRMFDATVDLIEHMMGGNGDFDDKAIELVNKIADMAEESAIYNGGKVEEGEQAEVKAEIETWNAKKQFKYMLQLITEAPTRAHMLTSICLLMPMIRAKLVEEKKIDREAEDTVSA